MPYLLYLRRSLVRRPKRHLSLFVILTCAFILPLLISIYRDSSAFGRRQQMFSETRGETFHVLNAREEDLALFRGIAGLSEPRYEDGIIYLHILLDDEWRDFFTMDDYSNAVRERIERAGSTKMTVLGFDYDYTHAISADSGQASLLILNLFIILLSAMTVGSAYKSHIRRFSSDMGVLRSLGAKNIQISLIFLTEFIVVFAMSAAAAVAISAGIMRILFSTLLKIDGVEGLAWVIFSMSPRNTALHIGVFFAMLLAVIIRTLNKASRESTVSEMRGDLQTSEMKKSPKSLKIKASPQKTLASLWLSRTNKAHAGCLLVAAPIATVFLFLFGYLSLDAAYITQPPEFEFMLWKNAEAFGGFTQEDVDYVENLPQVEHVSCRNDAPKSLFKEEPGALDVDVMEIKLAQPGLHREAEELLLRRFSGGEFRLHNYQAVVEKGAEMSKGIYLMLIFIFAAMFIFMGIIICMKLRDYIFDSEKTVKTLLSIGAPNGVVASSYVRQSAVSAAIAAAVSSAVSAVLLILATIPAAVKPKPDLPLVAAYILISLLTVCIFILPIKFTVSEVTKRKGSGI